MIRVRAQVRSDLILARIAAASEVALDRAGDRLRDEVVKNLDEENHIATGEMVDKTKRINAMRATPTRVKGGVRVGVDYAEDLEYGQPPSIVPLADLLRWARAKSARGRLFGDPEQVAPRAQRAIAEKGTEATYIFRRSLNDARDEVLAEVRRALRRIP